MKEFMKDTFVYTGTVYEKFEEKIQEIDSSTVCRIFPSSTIGLFSVQKKNNQLLATELPFVREEETEPEYLWRTLYGGSEGNEILKKAF